MSLALQPLFVTVTWGAGGTTSAKSLELAEICQRQLGLTTCLHLTCTNMSKKVVDEALVEAKLLGIRNILALRGDPPRSEEYRLEGEVKEEDEDFVWAVDLVKYIRLTYGDYFCIGVAGYPEGHSDESHPVGHSPTKDMPYLVEKIQAGADFIMTQLFYDQDAFLRYEKLVREWEGGILRNIPVIPGLMPIQNYQTLKRTSKLSHARLPADILARLEDIKGDDEEVKRIGVDIISEMVEVIKKEAYDRPKGFHFYTLNLEKAVTFILERCHLSSPQTETINSTKSAATNTSQPPSPPPQNLINGVSPEDQITSTSLKNQIIASSLTPQTRPSTNTSRPPILDPHSREATWDDYPNGRFGDARSPAFGEIDGYGLSLHLSPPAARRKWGSPRSRQDLRTLFHRHLDGDLDRLPWNEERGLSPETEVIRPELSALIEKGWWTIASQPAADGVPSDDGIFGWGPKGGFVFQKAFVEFFLPATTFHTHLVSHLTSAGIRDEISWYASSATNNFLSSEGPTAVNAVTWGAFPGKEIITPTIVEEVSFRAWAEEAYGIWAEWERCYGGTSAETAKFLRKERGEVVLVNVISHGFR